MSQQTNALIWFGCSAVWIGFALAGVSSVQNGVIGGICVAAGIAATIRHVNAHNNKPGNENREGKEGTS
jgi:hypothetical protein